ncbi:putative GH3 family protein [Lupinus albus]|uniref:Putative GH3 family protein n=1 Tax=Lupinus albus TaxID=3870 RepID=A0A6A4PW28_LUPAL|nr:putative GH3 family protein [Lupinus albus]
MLENLEEYTEKVRQEFEAFSKDAERIQRETLKRILEDNASTEYLLSLGLNGRTDPESFKACVPLVTHDDLEPYIQRILDGDNSPILTEKPITCMVLSSGTSKGKSKYIPLTDWYMESIAKIFHTSFSFRNRYSTSFLLFQSH